MYIHHNTWKTVPSDDISIVERVEVAISMHFDNLNLILDPLLELV